MNANRKFSEQELVRRKKYERLVKENKNPFLETKFERNYNSKKFIEVYDKFSREQLEAKKISNIKIPGRIRTIRESGKAIFMTLQDRLGNFQIYIKNDIVGNEIFNEIKDYDIGDILGVTGKVMKTKVGALTLNVEKVVLLTKALKPLPDKYHGMSDIEERYRRRYVDLIMNPLSMDVFLKRINILNEIRNYLNSKDYFEVETPILQDIHGGAAAKPFKTHHNALNSNLYLRIATELALKRLVVGGFEKVYEMGRIFRNEGISIKHNPEFTSIEIYVAYENMNYMMKLTENLINHLAKKLLNKEEIIYEKTKISLKKPWKRVHMVDFVKEVTGIDFWKEMTFEEAKKIAISKKLKIPKHFYDVGHIINLFFEEFGEKKIIQPTFIYGHPRVISPLSKADKNNPRFTERFELFIMGREYANAFTELNDPIEQYERFLEQVKEKKNGNEESYEMDIDFVEALEYGLPPTVGLGIGIDRLVMLLTNQSSIRDVLFFPQMKKK